jgi:hypothetical protein
MQRPLGSSSSMKLRINSILNACTRRGSFLGNNLGILGESLRDVIGCGVVFVRGVLVNVADHSVVAEGVCESRRVDGVPNEQPTLVSWRVGISIVLKRSGVCSGRGTSTGMLEELVK